MQILHILSQRPDSTGSGIYLREILKNAKKEGHKNFLICGLPFDEKIIPDSVDKNNCEFIFFNSAELPFHIVGMSDIMPYPSTRFCDLSSEQLQQYIEKFKDTIQKAIKKFKPDIIHSHHLWLASSLIPDLAPEIPVVTNCHGSDLRQFVNQPELAAIVQKGCVKLDHVSALTSSQRNDIAKLYKIDKNKISVVGGGFNSDIFNRESRKKSSDCLRMLYAGKLCYAKGVPYLLQALSKIEVNNYKLTLVGAGTGQEKEDCLSLASHNKQVTILPPVDQRKLANLLRETDLFILPSLFEGMPLVVLEALACGCNVLSSELPGVLEIIKYTSAEQINLISIPENHSSDKLNSAHESVFIDNIFKELTNILRAPHLITTGIDCNVEYFNWKNIFGRIQRVYMNFT